MAIRMLIMDMQQCFQCGKVSSKSFFIKGVISKKWPKFESSKSIGGSKTAYCCLIYWTYSTLLATSCCLQASKCYTL